MLKIAVIGCGKQADAHAVAIQGIDDCEIIAVCDTEELMAKQLYERFNIKYCFTDVNKMLEVACPDVVHVITPPQTHLALGKLCLDAGCHILFEKPFTLETQEAEALVRHAIAKNLKLTVGHNNQFSHASIRMRKLIGTGYLGGPPVHMESIWCYDLHDPAFAKAFLSDRGHWVRKLPGKLLHNIISHGVSKIAEYLYGDSSRVVIQAFTSPFLKNLGDTGIVDELRAIISDSEGTTAYFTFSTGITPKTRQFRIYGPQNSLFIDEDNQTLIKASNPHYKSYLNHFIPPAIYAKQYLTNSMTNISKFLRNDFHFEYGRKHLIELFYHSIRDGGPLPLSYREILLTSRIMDSIFAQINSAATPHSDTKQGSL